MSAMWIIYEKNIEHNNKACICFVHYGKLLAFLTVQKY